LADAAQHTVQRHDQQAAEHHYQPEALGLIPHPGPERLRGETVFVLAVKVGVDGPRKRGDREHDVELHPVDQRLQRTFARPFLSAIAHGGRPAEGEQAPQDDRAVEKNPELQPVPAFEVRVGAGSLVGRNRGQVGIRRDRRVERRRRLRGRRNLHGGL
jgi:hypothetical protein